MEKKIEDIEKKISIENAFKSALAHVSNSDTNNFLNEKEGEKEFIFEYEDVDKLKNDDFLVKNVGSACCMHVGMVLYGIS